MPKKKSPAPGQRGNFRMTTKLLRTELHDLAINLGEPIAKGIMDHQSMRELLQSEGVPENVGETVMQFEFRGVKIVAAETLPHDMHLLIARMYGKSQDGSPFWVFFAKTSADLPAKPF